MAQKTILILGGGIGGQVAANLLAKNLRGKHRVVLVERQKDFYFSPSFLWLMLGERSPNEISRPLSTLSKKGIEVLEGEAIRIDPKTKTVETTKGAISFDYLVISLGAELAPEKLPGLRESALNLYSLEGALKIKQALTTPDGLKKATVLISSLPFKCPAAPYEATFLIQNHLLRGGKNIEVEIFTPEGLPMPSAGPKVGETLKGMLDERGIHFYPNHKATAINSQEKTISFENGSKATFDLLVCIAPHQAPKVIKDSGLANEAGWVSVNKETLATQHDGVYAIGDVTSIPLEGGKSLPKAGVFAHYQAEVVAKNILAQLNGQKDSHKFSGKGWCAIEIGDGLAGFGSGNFYAEGGPKVKLYQPARYWHWGKVLFEKWWLWRWF